MYGSCEEGCRRRCRADGKRILVIQQVPHEDPGIIRRLAGRAGYELCFLEVYSRFLCDSRVPRTIDGYSALVVLGGPQGVYEADRYPYLTDEIKLIEDALKKRVPVLGVCLGSQLLAAAAGARAYKGERKKEIGWYPVEFTPAAATDPLTAGLPPEMTVFQWHGDTFDLPGGAKNLACSALYENQLVKVAPRAYAVQFHLEVTEDMVRHWLRVNSAELETVKGYIDPEAIERETPKLIPGLHTLGGTVIRRFLRMASLAT